MENYSAKAGKAMAKKQGKSTKPNKPKAQRVLEMYIRLCEGKEIIKQHEMDRYETDDRTFKRDIKEIVTLLQNRQSFTSTDMRTVEYSKKAKAWVMKGSVGSPQMNNAEIFEVSKVLLESRAFTQNDIDIILDKLVAGCATPEAQKLVSDLLINEKFHYTELKHRSDVKDRMWELAKVINENKYLMEIKYKKQVYNNEVVTRIVKPLAIMFSEYYFYLVAYIMQKNEEGEWEKKYDYPAIFRLDRIQTQTVIKIPYEVPYAKRFQDGEFRKRVQFMFPGKLETIKIKYTGNSPEAILDRLPTAEILSQNDSEYTIKAEVYGKGILMWLLSQGKRVEVLEPESLRQEMKQMLIEMLEKY